MDIFHINNLMQILKNDFIYHVLNSYINYIQNQLILKFTNGQPLKKHFLRFSHELDEIET